MVRLACLFVSGSILLAALVAAPLTAPAAGAEQDAVSFSFVGSKAYANAGTLRVGDVKLVRSGNKLRRVVAAGTIPGASGGSASFTIQLERVGPFFAGSILVDDPGAGFRQVTRAFAASIRGAGNTVSGELVWTDPVAVPPAPYRLAWSATDVVTPPPFALAIDSAIAPTPASVPDGRGGVDMLAAVADEVGTVSTFVANEVVIRPRSQAELADFLARTGGAILDDNAVPEPPSDAGITLAPADRIATEYTIRLDPSGSDLGNIDTYGRVIGVRGDHRVSSVLGAHLLALVAREAAEGLAVRPDFVYEGFWLRRTEERPDGMGGFADAFATSRFATTGSRSSVAAAWQFVQARQPSPRVKVAIIDGGFWLDGATGVPQTGPGEGSDLGPARPLQYDHYNEDSVAAGPNPSTCTGGATCTWHGNDSAGIALGQVNDREAAAGTGGLVADPILLRIEFKRSQVNDAVRTAVSWGAQVINMSFGAPCNYWCRNFEDDFEFGEARARGVVLVSPAGNSNFDVLADNYMHPCIEDGVICVGALENDTTMKRVSSCFGDGVDIYAPTDIPTMPNPDATTAIATSCTSPQDPATCLHLARGTSASAPFVAGVVAMMKSVNPGLDTFAVEAMLRSTAWTDSGDPFVPRFLNALAAVRAAAGNTLTPDDFEENDLATAPRPVAPGSYPDRTIDRVGDMDWHRLDLTNPVDLVVTADGPAALGSLGLSVQHDISTCGEALETTATRTAGQIQRSYKLARGQYLLPVGGVQSSVLPYDLTITTTPRLLAVDPYEIHDGLFDNDTLAHAFPFTGLAPSERRAAISAVADVDAYRVTSQGGFSNPILGTLSTRFSITTAHMPVTVDLYDASGTLRARSTSGPNCDPRPYVDVPAGSHFVVVTAAERGEYGFVIRERYVSGRLFDMRAFWRLLLDPSGPVQIVVREPFERYAFVFDDTLGPVSQLDLRSESLHATLLDLDENVLREGQTFPAGEGPRTESIELAGLVSGATYVLQLSRFEEIDFGSDAEPPALEAEIQVR